MFLRNRLYISILALGYVCTSCIGGADDARSDSSNEAAYLLIDEVLSSQDTNATWMDLYDEKISSIQDSLDSISLKADSISPTHVGIRGAILGTRLDSFNALKEIVEITYFKHDQDTSRIYCRRPRVEVKHQCKNVQITSILESGISQKDFANARDGGITERVTLAWKSPFSVINRHDLTRIYFLSRRKHRLFGDCDVAFYDLAEMTFFNIHDSSLAQSSTKDQSEKGFINTFNHITAQAFITAIFSEQLADFISDVHERYNMPELITGEFTDEQILDLNEGPLDNYADMINNEWGQELGQVIKTKYSIDRETVWTPELLCDVLNDIQRYYGWAFQIRFEPFDPRDDVVVLFSAKTNRIMNDLPAVQ